MTEKLSPEEKLLQDWHAAKENLNYIKNLESELRKQVFETFFNSTNESGTHTIDLGGDYKLKLKNSYSYKVDSDKVVECLEKIAEHDVETANTVIRWKPELSKKDYDKMNPELKAILNKALTSKLECPQIEFVEPKEKE